MPDIFTYTDYRAFLRDLLAEKRSQSGAFSCGKYHERLVSAPRVFFFVGTPGQA